MLCAPSFAGVQKAKIDTCIPGAKRQAYSPRIKRMGGQLRADTTIDPSKPLDEFDAKR